MKKIFLILAAAAAISFTAKKTDNKALAEVNQINGLFLFVESKPAGEFSYLGSVKSTGITGGSQFQSVRDRLIKKVKSEWPDANGIIFHFVNGGTDRADAIILK